ncbi:uncharacterized protein LOC113469904 [Diaphorina citri]|uniref:Uncharacterized protein LOC113469904 n=1 Tax=Diaphorina citri TaxID=121845 RepID=A0A3Q0J5M0_DIACI|nr:uncharacterized protein LOC113469904 [Diaphorina citri]
MSAHTEAVVNNTCQHNDIGDRCEDKGNSLHNVSGHVYKNTMGKCSCGCTTRLIIGSHIAHDIRHELLQTFHLTLSAGISYNKLLSKLVGSQHKPNQQTVIFPNAVLDLMGNIHLKKIPEYCTFLLNTNVLYASKHSKGDDIREEIEREMKTRNSIGITVRQNQTNKNHRSGDQKKKTAKQLSMLNFVQKK